MSADPDADLMLAVKKGDQRAFATLFDRHARSVVQFAYRFVGDRARAEELAQDVFMKLYRAAPNYEPNARFKTFLFRIAANHCMNERRRGEYKAPHASTSGATDEAPADLHSGDNHSPEQALEGRRLEAALGAALDALTPRERAAFAMARFEGLPYKEIAAALDASEPAIKSLIHRATLSVARALQGLTGAAHVS